MKEQFSNFEKEIITSLAAPYASQTYKDQLKAKIELQSKLEVGQKSYRKSSIPSPRFTLGWRLVLATSLLAIIIVLAVGPGKVWAEIQKTFGFLPGVGLVEKDSSIRTIAEPLSQTKDNITIDVLNVLLTSSETKIDYRVFGLGKSNFATENDPGCFAQPRLVLPDGTVLIKDGGSFPPIPAQVDSATLHIPCISGTKAETTPSDWHFDLNFILAENPKELLAVEFIPQPNLSITREDETWGQGGLDASQTAVTMGLGTAIELPDGYILSGYLDATRSYNYLAVDPKITDAKNQIVQVTYPTELMQLTQVEPLKDKADIFALAFKDQGLEYPLTVNWTYYPIIRHAAQSTAALTYEVGDNPQPGQAWYPDLPIEIDGILVTLKELRVERENSYHFIFEGPGNLLSVAVEMPDYASNGSGGGVNGFTGKGEKKEAHSSIVFDKLPTGQLKFYVTGISLYGEAITLSQTWQPATPHSQNHAQTPNSEVCLIGSRSSDINALTAFEEKLLVLSHAQKLNGEWSTTLKSNQNSQINSSFSAANIANFSDDGRQIVYPTQENGNDVLGIYDIASSQLLTLPAIGSDLSWSSDRSKIAMVFVDSKVRYPVYYNLETQELTPISDSEYVSIAGWSADSQTLYYAVPYFGSASWKLFAYSTETSENTELLTIENGTPKLLYPRISPDGRWLSYRGVDNSSLWVVELASQQRRLLMDASNVRAAIWLDESQLAMSISDEAGTFHLIVANIDTCKLFRVESVATEVMDVTLVR